MRRFVSSVLVLALLIQAAPSNAASTQDQPQVVDAQRLAAIEVAIAPYVAKAKQTYPAAKNRYLSGLPAGEKFYVTTRLRDQGGRFEQVFIRVTGINGPTITGQIASQLNLVTGYRPGQLHSFPESELVDWTILKADGSEEGNVVGKFLDTYQP